MGLGSSAWYLLGVDPFRWDEFGVAVVYSDRPSRMVEQSVMESTQHHQVVEVCRAAEFPFEDMVQCR